MEAKLGKDKLLPALLQKVAPPDTFEAIQAADLIGWNGAVDNPRVFAFVRRVCEKLGRPAFAPTDMIEELMHLPAIMPLPDLTSKTLSAAPNSISADHNYAFWKTKWEHQKAGKVRELLVALGDKVSMESPILTLSFGRNNATAP
ncbi:MAG: hypothetical protein AAFR90_15505 [Pseudomonadota bacterium]